MSSLRDIRLSYTEQKHDLDRSNLWLYLVIRRVSFYPTWACLRLGISANQATFISIVFGVLGCVFLAAGGHRNSVTGALLVSGWSILDCVDGNLARLTRSTGKYGRFIDALTGSMMGALLLTSVGIGAFNQPDNVANALVQLFPTGLQDYVGTSSFLILGAWGSLTAIFYSLVSELFENIFSQPLFGDSADKGGSSSWSSTILLIGGNVTGFGLLEPLLLVAAVFNCLSLLVVYYALVHSGVAVLVMAQAIRKAKRVGTTVNSMEEVLE